MMEYEDLPKELRVFFDARTTSIDPDARIRISQGWNKMTPREKQQLVKRLRAEPDPLRRIIIANMTATRATIDFGTPIFEVLLFDPDDRKRAFYARAMLDTGAQETVLTETFADTIPGASLGDIVLYGLGGAMRAYRKRIGIEINGIKHIADVCVVPKGYLPLENVGIEVIIGWDLLKKHDVFSHLLVRDRVVNDVAVILSNISTLKEKSVLILGSERTSLDRMRAIKSYLEKIGTGYAGIIVRDYADIPVQSTEEKVVMFASLCRFVLCEDSEPGGQIDELKICATNRFVTAILREKSKRGTFMQEDYPVDYAFINIFEYDSLDEIVPTLEEAITWCEAKVKERQEHFNEKYPWRNS